MSVDSPPSVGSLQDATGQLHQWSQNVPADILEVDRQAMAAWFSSLAQLADALQQEKAAAQGLRIDEGAVGDFVSAKATARNLNDSGDAIRQRLDEFSTFVNSLHDFAYSALNKIREQDGQ